MKVLFNKKGALILEVMAATTILGIIASLMFVSYINLYKNTSDSYNIRILSEESSYIYNYSTKITNHVSPELGHFVHLDQSNLNSCSELFLTSDIEICEKMLGLKDTDIRKNFERNIYFVNYSDLDALTELKKIVSKETIEVINTIENEPLIPSLNKQYIRMIIEIKLSDTNRVFSIGKVLEL